MPLILNGTTGVSGVDGTAATPAIKGGDADTGVVFGTNEVSVSTGGTARVVVNSDGQTVLGAGTAALPAVTTTGDTNTGIYFPAADTIAFAEGGAESARLDSSGNLLVGTTVTGGGKVCVKNTPSTQWGIDFNECTYSIANGSNGALPTGSGMIVINDPTQSGAIAVYIVGAASVVLVSATGTFVAPTTTPGAGTASIQHSGGSYRIYNNIGTTINFKVAMFRTRNNN